MGRLATLCLVVLAGVATGGAMGERQLEKEVVVRAPVETVWQAWTTVEGLKFVSNRSRVELRPGGAYEWFLDLEPDEHGRRGGQGARLLEIEPLERLRFTWTFPPNVPTLRSSQATTEITVRFRDNGDGTTTVSFVQAGWKTGEDWDAGYAYFDRAWDFVLTRLREALDGASG